MGPQMDPKMAPKLVQKLLVLGSIFGSFSSGFGAPWVPLGSPLGPPEALLGGLYKKNAEFYPSQSVVTFRMSERIKANEKPTVCIRNVSRMFTFTPRSLPPLPPITKLTKSSLAGFRANDRFICNAASCILLPSTLCLGGGGWQRMIIHIMPRTVFYANTGSLFCCKVSHTTYLIFLRWGWDGIGWDGVAELVFQVILLTLT